ncbi:MAG: hypothetical protein EBZ48_17465 [Proteobacteria bacterium]|nr:hypothetical protein [Pseudomonadota bacterium]
MRQFAENFKRLKVHPPYEEMVMGWTNNPQSKFVFHELPKKVDLEHFPFMPFRDSFAAVVELEKLRQLVTQDGSIASGR